MFKVGDRVVYQPPKENLRQRLYVSTLIGRTGTIISTDPGISNDGYEGEMIKVLFDYNFSEGKIEKGPKNDIIHLFPNGLLLFSNNLTLLNKPEHENIKISIQEG